MRSIIKDFKSILSSADEDVYLKNIDLFGYKYAFAADEEYNELFEYLLDIFQDSKINRRTKDKVLTTVMASCSARGRAVSLNKFEGVRH